MAFLEIAQAATEALEAEASTGVLGTLGINWKIFIAQLINFGIVALVLRHFVYVPLLKAMDKRSRAIAQGLNDAKKYEAKLQEIEKQKRTILEQSRTEASKILKQNEERAEAAKQALLSKAEEAAGKIISEAREGAVLEKEKMFKEIKTGVAGLVAAALQKVLAEKLDERKDEELIKESLKRIKI